MASASVPELEEIHSDNRLHEEEDYQPPISPKTEASDNLPLIIKNPPLKPKPATNYFNVDYLSDGSDANDTIEEDKEEEKDEIEEEQYL